MPPVAGSKAVAAKAVRGAVEDEVKRIEMRNGNGAYVSLRVSRNCEGDYMKGDGERRVRGEA